jgi:hypothetical protein
MRFSPKFITRSKVNKGKEEAGALRPGLFLFDRLGSWVSLEVSKDAHFQLLRYPLLAHIAPAQLARKHSSNCAGEISRTPPIWNAPAL